MRTTRRLVHPGFLLLVFAMGAQAQETFPHQRDYPHHVWGMHWLWWLFWILVIVAVLWALSRLLMRPAPPPEQAPPEQAPPESPLDRLERRYADGEISTEEYEERKATLLRDR
jgi:putative membrane protein